MIGRVQAACALNAADRIVSSSASLDEPDRVRLVQLTYCPGLGAVRILQRVDVMHLAVTRRGLVVVTTQLVNQLSERDLVLPVRHNPPRDLGSRSVPGEVLWHLRIPHFVDAGPESCLLMGPNGDSVTTRTLQRHWDKARKAIGRPDLRLYDMRHSGLTLAAAQGASLAELMRRGGHATPAAALNYQHATDLRDQALANGLAALALQSMTGDAIAKGHTAGTTPESEVDPVDDVAPRCPELESESASPL